MATIKICLDAGHYGKYNRSPVYPSYYESDMSWKLHNLLAAELESYGIEVVKTRANQETDRELVSRGYASKGCNLFLSLHSNAAASASANYAIAIHLSDKPGVAYDDKAAEIAKKLAKAIGDTMGCEGRTGTRSVGNWDRDGNGKYDDEYYGVLQGAKQAQVPGIILEHGFHTNLAQAKWLSVEANLQKLAVAEASVIAAYFGCKKQDQTAAVTYRIRVGSYKKKTSAEAMQKKLKTAGFDSTIIKIGSVYRCQAGSFTVKANATAIKKKLIAAGFEATLATIKPYEVYGCSFLNLRKTAGGEIIRKLKNGEAVTYGGTSKTLEGVKWLKITLSDGSVGWASATYLRKR